MCIGRLSDMCFHHYLMGLEFEVRRWRLYMVTFPQADNLHAGCSEQVHDIYGIVFCHCLFQGYPMRDKSVNTTYSAY